MIECDEDSAGESGFAFIDPNQFLVAVKTIKNGERKSLRQSSVKAEKQAVDSGIEEQRVDIGIKRVQKVLAEPSASALINFAPATRSFSASERISILI
mgnify:CR=1 FL=1